MYSIGDIKKGSSINKGYGCIYIYSACSNCGRERWVRLLTTKRGRRAHGHELDGVPKTHLCSRCSSSKNSSGGNPNFYTCGETHPRWSHGMSHTKLHNIWISMRSRCYSKSSCSYKYYGGRGIKIIPEWNDFSIFLHWAESNGYQEGLSIHRIDNNDDYKPSNCEWITTSENSHHKLGMKYR